MPRPDSAAPTRPVSPALPAEGLVRITIHSRRGRLRETGLVDVDSIVGPRVNPRDLQAAARALRARLEYAYGERYAGRLELASTDGRSRATVPLWRPPMRGRRRHGRHTRPRP